MIYIYYSIELIIIAAVFILNGFGINIPITNIILIIFLITLKNYILDISKSTEMTKILDRMEKIQKIQKDIKIEQTKVNTPKEIDIYGGYN